MLEHSRGVSGERRDVDLNALVDEALNLAYHAARAQDAGFNITLERDLDPAVAPIELAPQELTRVLLNLFGNGFYAARGNGEAAYRPTLQVSSRDLSEAVEVRVRDNGTGIPREIRDQLFQPFFTTKPTGEGTGLGLSIGWDIARTTIRRSKFRRRPMPGWRSAWPAAIMARLAGRHRRHAADPPVWDPHRFVCDALLGLDGQRPLARLPFSNAVRL